MVPKLCGAASDVLLQMGPYPIDVERTRDAERPRERRAALGTGEALRDGVQPRTTPREPPSQAAASATRTTAASARPRDVVGFTFLMWTPPGRDECAR